VEAFVCYQRRFGQAYFYWSAGPGWPIKILAQQQAVGLTRISFANGNIQPVKIIMGLWTRGYF